MFGLIQLSLQTCFGLHGCSKLRSSRFELVGQFGVLFFNRTQPLFGTLAPYSVNFGLRVCRHPLCSFAGSYYLLHLSCRGLLLLAQSISMLPHTMCVCACTFRCSSCLSKLTFQRLYQGPELRRLAFLLDRRLQCPSPLNKHLLLLHLPRDGVITLLASTLQSLDGLCTFLLGLLSFLDKSCFPLYVVIQCCKRAVEPGLELSCLIRRCRLCAARLYPKRQRCAFLDKKFSLSLKLVQLIIAL